MSNTEGRWGGGVFKVEMVGGLGLVEFYCRQTTTPDLPIRQAVPCEYMGGGQGWVMFY